MLKRVIKLNKPTRSKINLTAGLGLLISLAASGMFGPIGAAVGSVLQQTGLGNAGNSLMSSGLTMPAFFGLIAVWRTWFTGTAIETNNSAVYREGLALGAGPSYLINGASLSKINFVALASVILHAAIQGLATQNIISGADATFFMTLYDKAALALIMVFRTWGTQQSRVR